MLKQLRRVVGWEVDDPDHIGVNIVVGISDGEDKILLVSFCVVIGSNWDGTGLEGTKLWENNIGIVVNYGVCQIMSSSVYHVEGVELTDWSWDTKYSHGIVTLNELRGICEFEDYHVVDIIEVVERVKNDSILSGYFYLQSWHFSIDITEIFTNNEGKLLVSIQNSGKVEIDGHCVVTERV